MYCTGLSAPMAFMHFYASAWPQQRHPLLHCWWSLGWSVADWAAALVLQLLAPKLSMSKPLYTITCTWLCHHRSFSLNWNKAEVLMQAYWSGLYIYYIITGSWKRGTLWRDIDTSSFVKRDQNRRMSARYNISIDSCYQLLISSYIILYNLISYSHMVLNCYSTVSYFKL